MGIACTLDSGSGSRHCRMGSWAEPAGLPRRLRAKQHHWPLREQDCIILRVFCGVRASWGAVEIAWQGFAAPASCNPTGHLDSNEFVEEFKPILQAVLIR